MIRIMSLLGRGVKPQPVIDPNGGSISTAPFWRDRRTSPGWHSRSEGVRPQAENPINLVSVDECVETGFGPLRTHRVAEHSGDPRNALTDRHFDLGAIEEIRDPSHCLAALRWPQQAGSRRWSVALLALPRLARLTGVFNKADQ